MTTPTGTPNRDAFEWAAWADLRELGVRPAISEESKPFWDGAEGGQLLIQRCVACGLHLFPPRGICRRCLHRETSWVKVEGPAVIHAYTVNHHPWTPGIDPYVVVLVELPEHDDVRLVGLLRDVVDEPQIGDLVSIGFDESGTGLSRHYFSPWVATS